MPSYEFMSCCMQDLASDLEDEHTARIIAEEAASSNCNPIQFAIRDVQKQLLPKLHPYGTSLHAWLSKGAFTRRTLNHPMLTSLSLSDQVKPYCLCKAANVTAASQSWQRQVAHLSLQLDEQQRNSQQVASELQARLAELSQLAADREEQSAESSRFIQQQAKLATAEMTSLRLQLTQLTQQLTGQCEQSEGLTVRLRAAEETRVFSQEQQASLTELSLLRMQLTDFKRQLDAQHEERTHLGTQHEAAH